jgi:hypothetical protein
MDQIEQLMTNYSKLTNLSEEELDAIEAHLAGILRPVAPRRDFVQSLGGRIHIPPRSEITVRLTDWRKLVLVFSGVLSGALAILTVGRAMYHLFGRRNAG